MRNHKLHKKTCVVCGERFSAARSDAQCCSAGCRVKKARGIATGQGKSWYAVKPEMREMADAIRGRVSAQTFANLETVLKQHGAIAAEWAIAACWSAMQDYKYGFAETRL